MNEILKYVSIEKYEKEKKIIKDGETKVIYKNDKLKIKLMREGKKVYNIIIVYGTRPIQDIIKDMLLIGEKNE